MGIYIHLPFCQSKCYYCGFYSVASMQLKKRYIEALCKEAELRKGYLGSEDVRTLYFGGGTPSCLSLDELNQIVITLDNIYHLEKNIERTIEVNPEDVDPTNLDGWMALGFNRLSMGVQSLNDEVLKRINRRHTAQCAIRAVEEAYRRGFRNISIDLMIGLPGYAGADLCRDLDIIGQLPVTHLSVYMLSIDPGTVFEHRLKKGTFHPQDEDIVAEQYLLVCDYLKSIGFEHYEISNFARNFKYSRHNTAYWQQKPYLGLGAAAHSYDIDSRQWNVAHLKRYIDSLDKDILCFEKEILTEKDRFNEYLMTNFRTQWGIEPAWLAKKYPDEWNRMARNIDNYCKDGFMYRSGEKLCMTERGWLISDAIFSELFM